MSRLFHLVDVFSSVPFGGNPLAVVLEADDLSTDEMQAITRWMNLSETTFLLPPTHPEADYRVRIFTLDRELPFAGHPTLGTCHTWLATEGIGHRGDRVVQECGAGLIDIRRREDRLTFAAPPLLRSGPVDDELAEELRAVLRLEPADVLDSRWIDNGPGWVGILLEDADSVLAVEPDLGRFTGPGMLEVGLVGPHPEGSEEAFEIRALSIDGSSLSEDPVTGSLNASVGQWLFETGRATSPYVARQGTRLGRHGRIHVERDVDGQVWVGGATVTRVEGRLRT
ncbi:PhzF family phenazine biosynthesis protein [Nitriliruptor alkaliphilus]|uniref:PhzF family phenazine biosynthesis protein n=1 Tax=Nitriliruptor alkaliphilus TaxID=427918 RepID=UPI00069855A3|nr:PhzF family phenazine biosynthesis protein [Nitriliruptor alkaliphilus]